MVYGVYLISNSGGLHNRKLAYGFYVKCARLGVESARSSSGGSLGLVVVLSPHAIVVLPPNERKSYFILTGPKNDIIVLSIGTLF